VSDIEMRPVLAAIFRCSHQFLPTMGLARPCWQEENALVATPGVVLIINNRTLSDTKTIRGDTAGQRMMPRHVRTIHDDWQKRRPRQVMTGLGYGNEAQLSELTVILSPQYQSKTGRLFFGSRSSETLTSSD